jgi:hypothetical protein
MENQEYKTLKILHVVFCIGTSAVLLINNFIKEISFDNLSGEIDITSLFVIALSTVMAVLSITIYNKMVGSAHESNIDYLKLRQAYIIKWGLIEAGALISFIYYFYLDGHQLTLISGLTLLILLVISGPRLSNYE